MARNRPAISLAVALAVPVLAGAAVLAPIAPFAPVLAAPAAPASLSAAATADNSLFEQARRQRQAFLEELEALVSIDSGSRNREGLARLATHLATRLEQLGAEVERLPATPSVGTTVVGRLRGEGQARILMMIHMDTVFPEGEAARRPFRVDAERAYGPGVADAKGGVAMILQSLEIARKRGFRDYGQITVMFNPDEEISSVGSREVIRRLAAENDVVLSYEPPQRRGAVIGSTKGIAYLELEVKGTSSHAGAAPEQGRNAAVELAHQMLQLGDLGDPARGTTVNWTVVQSGDAKNRIPDLARATADMRMTQPGEVERVRQLAQRRIGRSFVAGTSTSLELNRQRPPLPPNPATARLAELAAGIYGEIGLELEPIAMGFGTDAGFAYDPGGDGPAVLEGLGVVGDRLHSPDEWTDLETIPARLYLTVRLLEEVAKQP